MKTLVLDDDVRILQYFKSVFSDEELSNIEFISDPDECVEKLDNGVERVISDYKLVGSHLNGIDVLKTAREKGITQLMLLTAVSRPINSQCFENKIVCIRKPISREDFRELCLKNQTPENLKARLV